jgi:hypothetical protein
LFEWIHIRQPTDGSSILLPATKKKDLAFAGSFFDV